MKKVYDSGDEIAKVLGVDPQTIALDHRGVVLTPSQVSLLLTTVFANGHKKGYENAVSLLKSGAENANTEGNLDRWAIYLAGAAFLEGQPL